MDRRTRHLGALAAACAVLAMAWGCAALREVAALRDVDFRIAGVNDVFLAGVDMTRVRSYEDLSLVDAGRLTAAIVRKTVPVAFDLQLEAENPASNSVNARLVALDWTLLLEDRETIRGTLDRAVTLPPGETRTIPIAIRLDLLEFFEGQAQDLVQLALAIAGHGSTPKTIALQAVPTVDTALGPIRYPQPITIVRQQVGG